MTTFEMATGALALVGAAITVAGLVTEVRAVQARPFRSDVAPAKGSARRGIAYAFTEGMAPWAKEGTRRHVVAYLRGIGFHVGVFLALALLVVSPWLGDLTVALRTAMATGLAAATVLAVSGFALRLREPALLRVSTPDDYFSLGLVTAFLATAALAAAMPSTLPAFWTASAVVLAYAPFGKLRHALFFFYSRTFFGLFFGRRGVLAVSR